MTAAPGSVPIALDHRRLRQLGRRRHPGRPQDLHGLRRLRRLRDHRADGAEHAGVRGVETVSPAFVVAQIDAVLADLEVGAIKTGMLATADDRRRPSPAGWPPDRRLPLVVDPVMVATSGDVLIAPDAVEAVRSELLPLATLITPNLPEAARLLGRQAGRQRRPRSSRRPRRCTRSAAGAVLIKGGHGEGDTAVDYPLRRRERRSASRGRASTPATRTAPAARCRRPSRPCWRRARPCPRRWSGPRPSSGRGCRQGRNLRHRAWLGSRRRPVRHPPPNPSGLMAGVSLLQPVQVQLPGWPDSG